MGTGPGGTASGGERNGRGAPGPPVEERLRALEERLQALVESIPGVACSFQLGPGGQASMPYSAPGIEDLYGVPAAVLARTFEPVQRRIHPDDLPRVLEGIAASAERRTRWHDSFRYLHPVKGLRWMEGWSVPGAPSPDGALIWHGYVCDFTDQRRAEEALREQASLLDLAHDAILVRDPDDAISYWNRGAERTYGWTREEALGRSPQELLGTQFPVPLPQFLEEVVRCGSWEGELKQRHRDGRTIVVASRWAVRPQDGGDGRPGFLEINRDITEGRRSAALLREWLESIPALAWRTDAVGQIVARNRRWREYTGQEQAEGPVPWLHLVHPDDRDPVAETVRAAVAAGGPFEGEFRLRRVDGTYRWFLGRAPAVRDASGALVWMGIAIDIQDRRCLEQAMREADRRKDEFLGVLSHELRNPLASIASAVFVLQRTDPAAEPARQAREVIGRQVNQLARLTDDLLDVTRIARGKISLQRALLDLAAVVHQAGEDHRALLEDRGLTLGIRLPAQPVWVEGDATRLAQVVGNLLSNSAKFTRPGGHVEVVVRTEGPQAEVRVRDDGVGIDPSLLEHVFEPFAQGSQDLARTAGGLGLGLALVKGLAELHGGGARAHSAGEGHGAEVVITLPQAEAARPAAPEPTAARPAGARPLHVLVVDDSRDTAESLAHVVQIFGHEAEVAPDGPTALAKARAHPPDVVLCDIGLPGMNGYEVARAFRSRGEGAPRLVAVSGYAQPEDLRAAADAGFERHLAKPPRFEELERLLDSVARERRTVT